MRVVLARQPANPKAESRRLSIGYRVEFESPFRGMATAAFWRMLCVPALPSLDPGIWRGSLR